MTVIKITLTERVDLSRKHNPVRANHHLSNEEMLDIMLDLYGINKLTDDPLDLTFEVVDDKSI